MTRRNTTDEPTRDTDPETGREILVYASGARKYADDGKFLNGPTIAEYNPVLADPAAMQKRGRELAQARTRQAINDQVGETLQLDLSQASDSDGWYWLIRHTVNVYLQSKNIRGLGEVLGKLGIAAGYLSREGEARPAHSPQGITASAEELAALLEILEESKAMDRERERAIDGTVTR